MAATRPAKEAPLIGSFEANEEQRSKTFLIKNYTIPSRQTVYMDVFFNLDDDEKDIFHVVGGNAIVDQKAHLHHFVVTGCARKVPESQVGVPQEQDADEFACDNHLGGFAGWAPGGGNMFQVPTTAGIPIGRSVGVVAFKVNIHYTDGDKSPGTVDQSGIRVLYTSTLRQNTIRANVIIGIGGSDSMHVPAGKDRFFITRSCSVSAFCSDVPDSMMSEIAGVTCKEAKAAGMCSMEEASDYCPMTCGFCKMGKEWPVFGAFHHAHLLGAEMYLDRQRGNEWIDMGSMPIWHFDDQAMAPLSARDVTIRDGDKIQATCVFNSIRKDQATKFGRSTYDEMCFNMIITMHPTDSVSNDMPFAFTCHKELDRELEPVWEFVWAGELAVGEDAHMIHTNHRLENARDVWEMYEDGNAGKWIGKKGPVTSSTTTTTTSRTELLASSGALSFPTWLPILLTILKFVEYLQ